MVDILFYIFASLALLAAIGVITFKNSVYAVFSLILVFFATAVTWLLLQAEFLAISLILVYVGAVMVLFLFVVMMIDVDFYALMTRYSRWLPIALVVSGLLALAIFKVLRSGIGASTVQAIGDGQSNVELLGKMVFTQYLLPFEIAGVILFAAIIAAISLIYRGPRMRKVQNIAQQIKVKAKDRLHLVDGI